MVQAVGEQKGVFCMKRIGACSPKLSGFPAPLDECVQSRTPWSRTLPLSPQKTALVVPRHLWTTRQRRPYRRHGVWIPPNVEANENR